MMTMYSSGIFIFAALLATSGLVPILTNGQTLSEKWKIDDDPAISFNELTNTFTLTFEVDDSITQANTATTIWEQGCAVEGNQLLAADGIDGATAAVDTMGEGYLTFNLDAAILAQNSNVFTSLPSENSAEMKICARFILQTDGFIEVNFIETIITIVFDLTAGFEVDAFTVTAKEKISAADEKGYDVDAYLCDPENPGVPLSDLIFNQGSLISVCVTPTDESIADGLFLETIDSFDWVRGFIEQPAIENRVQASNQLTAFECVPGSIYCSFSSILIADFYQPTRPPTSSPSEAPTSEATICEGLNQTSQTTLNFSSASVEQNDLQSGGQLRFGNIGEINGEMVDLMVTSEDYNPNANSNGKHSSGNFGEIGVTTVANNPDSGKATIDFCLVQSNTNVPIMADSFQWSVFDIDNRNGRPNLHEKVSIDTSQASGYSFYPDMASTELQVFCENDGSAPPCDEGVRTIFEGTTVGNGQDNPTDPNSLTEQQKKRSVVFTFTDTACWTLEFNSYCPSEPEMLCGKYGGSKLLFGGGASQVVSQGTTECSSEEESYDSRYLAEMELDGTTVRDLKTSAEVAGVGQATMRFGGARRLTKNKRALQGDAGPQANIELLVGIQTVGDELELARTAGGSSSWSSLFFIFICGLLVNAATIVFA